jgi:hypothetical protein
VTRRLVLVSTVVLTACGGTAAVLSTGQQRGERWVMDCTDYGQVVCVERTTSTTETTSAMTTSTPTTLPLPTSTIAPPDSQDWLGDNFLIGVDLQAASLADNWAARGVNTMVRLDSDMQSTDAQIETWEQAAAAAGLRTIRQPKSDPALDVGNTTLLAWSPHKDEPDGNFHPTPADQVPYETVQADYAELKHVDPTRPITIGVSGTFNQNDARYWPSPDPADGARSCCEPWYRKYFEGADWLAADRYPINLGKEIAPELRAMMTNLQTWQEPERAKPVFAYIEASDYDTTTNHPAPGPSADQLRAEVWHVITEGARGIIYFPERVAPTFAHDATTASVRAEMSVQHARITELAPILQGPSDPIGVSITAPAPLEVGWRATTTDAYLIVVNPTSTAQNAARLTMTGVSGSVETLWENRLATINGDTIIDDFPAYAVHVYRVPLR